MANNYCDSVIPIIDLQDLPGQYQKLRKACEDWGCFRVVNHNISLALMSDMKRVVRSLLDLPVDIKKRYTDVLTGSEYVAPSLMNPLYEALGIYDTGSPQAVATFCSQLEATPHQRETIETYTKATRGVSMDIARKLAESMGLKSDLFDKWPSQFWINKYNFTPETVGSSGVRIHSDISFLTILQDDENVGGLEVKNMSGEFVAVDPAPGTLLIIIGDIAKVWSNGRLRNVPHRVQCKEATVRNSIVTLLQGPREEAVEAPLELVDSEHPRLYAPFSYEDYRKLRNTTKLRAGEALELLRAQS